MAILGIVLGTLIFVGALTFQAVFLIAPPCTGTFCPTLTADQAAYESTIHALAWVGIIVFDLSAGLSVMLAFALGGRNDVPEATRRSVFIFATVYLAVFIIFGFLGMLSFISSIRYL